MEYAHPPSGGQGTCLDCPLSSMPKLPVLETGTDYLALLNRIFYHASTGSESARGPGKLKV